MISKKEKQDPRQNGKQLCIALTDKLVSYKEDVISFDTAIGDYVH
jgi:hypothetical protein